MDFLSAVRSLQNGECEGIRRKSWEAYQVHNAYSPEFDNQSVSFTSALADDWELVNPIPQTEEVTEKRRICPKCSEIYDDGNICQCENVLLVDCIVRYSRPVKKRVKYTVEVEYRLEKGLLGIRFVTKDGTDVTCAFSRLLAEIEADG